MEWLIQVAGGPGEKTKDGEVRWEWECEPEVWTPHPKVITRQIEAGVAKGAVQVTVQARGHPSYMVQIKNKQQLDTSTGKSQRIRRTMKESLWQDMDAVTVVNLPTFSSFSNDESSQPKQKANPSQPKQEAEQWASEEETGSGPDNTRWAGQRGQYNPRLTRGISSLYERHHHDNGGAN